MIKSMRKHRKKWLAIFGVVLMVAFLIPTTGSFFQNPNPVAYRYGPKGKDEIRAGEHRLADQEWTLLSKGQLVASVPTQYGTRQWRPVAEVVLGGSARSMDGLTYLLLLKEAQQMGIKVSQTDLQTIANEVKYVERGAAPVAVQTDEDHINDPQTRAAINLWTIANAFRNVASGIRVSEPVALRGVVDSASQLSTFIAQFDARNYAATQPATVPASPTAEEIKQFNEFKNVEAGKAADPVKNPFGFGYKYPNRVKVQYIEIARDEIANNISVPDRALLRWYREHQSEYPPVEVPATQPATKPLAGPRPTPATEPSTKPTTRPATFADVKEQIRKQRIGDMTSLVVQGMVRDIKSRMSDDYSAWQNKKLSSVKDGSGQPIAYDDPFYMKALTLDIEQKWQQKYIQLYREQFAPSDDELKALAPRPFTLRYVMSDAWQTAKTLPDLGKRKTDEFASEGIGTAALQQSIEQLMQRMPRTSFTQLVMGCTEAFLTEKQKAERKREGMLLSVWQLGPELLSSSYVNYYLFRLTAAQPAHEPASIDEVLLQVREDLAAAKAYANAKAKADEFLKVAKAKGGVQFAANELNLPKDRLAQTGLFKKYDDMPTTRAVSSDVAPKFHREAFKLVSELKPDQKHPVRLIEVPTERVVIVAELNAFEPAERDEGFAARLVYERSYLKGSVGALLMREWFSPASVRTRMNVVDAKGNKLPDEDAQASSAGDESPID